MRGQDCILQGTEVEATFGRYVLPNRFNTFHAITTGINY